MKFQQYTGPVQAKGLEDTAFFRYNPLLSLCEVGSDVERFGRTVEEFHQANAKRRSRHPFEMTATATHDTKLGEDTRARINVLSEMPDEWAREVRRWMRLNQSHRTVIDGEPAPDRKTTNTASTRPLSGSGQRRCRRHAPMKNSSRTRIPALRALHATSSNGSATTC